MEAKALLFDTRSIQRYIFSGNRLKTNIGASYLVERVYDDILINKILEKEFPGEVDSQRIYATERSEWKELGKKCTVAYVGGGNALIIFRMDTEDDIQKKIVIKFSKQLLVSHPGLHIGAAFGTLDISSPESVQEGIDKLYEKLKKNQATVFPKVNVPYTGLTLTCEVNGETANFYNTGSIMGKAEGKGNGARFFSREAVSKTEAEEAASIALKAKFDYILERYSEYEFPRALDELGQKRNESRSNYIAIVHIDGNNMGQKFRKLCNDLEDRRILANEIRRKTEGSFGLLLEWILEKCEKNAYKDELELIPKEKDSSIKKGKKIIPIRPLILGGDDVTFICPAKVAVIFTKYFMEKMLAQPPEAFGKIESEVARRVDSCAGIAILPTSYPFFRGYKLAEQLCDNAKQRMRGLLPEIAEGKDCVKVEDLLGTSWLDFAILHGEQAPTLEQIREREYSGMRGAMHFGPYQVGNDHAEQNKDCTHNIENLLDCVYQFQIGSKEDNEDISALPISKIKEMRNVLQQGKSEAKRFIDQMNLLGQNLPHIEDWKMYEDSLWSDGETPYVDAIEMMDFIPEGV